jgi:hypothetical protein
MPGDIFGLIVHEVLNRQLADISEKISLVTFISQQRKNSLLFIQSLGPDTCGNI